MAHITLIGAGSASFALELVKDICKTRSLEGSVLTLMDINTRRLATTFKICRKLIEQEKIKLTLKKTHRLEESLKGAEFVICAVKVGGYENLEKERVISEKHGYYRGFGDRVSCYFGGIGGYFQFKFLKELGEAMERICPEAYLVQTANPVFDGTQVVVRTSRIKAIGVCHGHFHYRELARAIHVSPDEVTAVMAGLNHYIFLLHFSHRGKNLYPRLDQWVKKESGKFYQSDEFRNKNSPMAFEQLCPASVEMYRLYGYFPIGDAIRAASPWWFHVDFTAKEKWFGKGGGFDSEVGWNETYLKNKTKKVSEYYRLAEKNPKEAIKTIRSGYEQHIPLIDSLANDQERILQLNIPNEGMIENIPNGVMVEVPTMVNSRGVHGLRIGKMPPSIMNHILQPRLILMEQMVDAFLNRCRKTLILSLMTDPRTRSYNQAEKVIAEILDQPWNTELKKYYR